MRFFSIAGLMVSMLWAAPVLAQTQQEMIVAIPEARVYSGPSTKFYPTSVLHMGERVQVVQTTDNQPGWYAIKPPAGSFSWISQRFVQLSPDGKIGTVVADHEVPVLPGSSLTNQPPNVERAKLKRGSLVVILDQPLVSSTGIWLPIAPPPAEVRYIEAYGVKATNVAANPAPGNGSASSGQPPPGHPASMAAAPPSSGAWQPANQPRTQGLTTSLYKDQVQPAPAAHVQPAPAAPATSPNLPQYSPYGTLRKTAFQIDGQPIFVLESRAGQPILYAASMPGYSLSRYVGRTVSLYGAMSYRSDEYLRNYYMTATHVVLP